MSLKVYNKAPAYAVANYSAPKQYFVVSGDVAVERTPFTMWSLVGGVYDAVKWLVASSNSAGLIIPLVLIAAGLGFIYTQIQPSIKEEVAASLNLNNQGNATLVAQDYIESKLQYVSNPGLDYFQELAAAAKEDGVFIEDQEAMAINSTLYLTIPKLKINRLPIKTNVDSSSGEAYKQVLDTHLAHFRGSSLPSVSRPGNIVVYGHSVGGSYTPRPNDVVSAFTFLGDLKVGDEIFLEMNGVQYKYLMRRSSIVMPNDTAILNSQPGKEMLTLFTCWTPGNRDKRLVIQAVPQRV